MSKPEDRSAVVTPRLVDEILDEQRRHWSHGERILVETYLQRLPALASDPGIILDLIYNEIVLREKTGEQPQLQEYSQRFPQLRAELALQFEVDRGLDWQAVTDASSVDDAVDPQPIRDPSGGTPFPTLPGYSIAGVLGRGATGVVYKARQISQDRSVAVKVVLGGMRQQASALGQLRAEAGKLAALHHPHLCPIHEIGVDAGRLFIAQERVETSLAKRQTSSPVTPLQAAQWLATLAQTIHDIHRLGIVHGNLTPANILLSYNGIVKITDIGLARFVEPNPNRNVAQTCTFRALPLADVDIEAHRPVEDVYALGAILFTLLGGRKPVEIGENAPDLQSAIFNLKSSHVPRELATICLYCLHAEPDRRYASAALLADDLTAFLAGRPIKARRPGILAGLAHSIGRWNVLSGKTRPAAEVHRWLQAVTQQRLRAERVQLTLDMTSRLMRTPHRDEFLRQLAEVTAWLTDAELVTVFMVDRQRGDLRAQVTRDTEVVEMRVPAGVGIAGTVAATGEPLNLSDAPSDPRFDPHTDRRPGVKTRTLLALPMTNSNGDVLAVVQAINKCDGAFSADDLDAMSALLGAAAVAFERTA